MAAPLPHGCYRKNSKTCRDVGSITTSKNSCRAANLLSTAGLTMKSVSTICVAMLSLTAFAVATPPLISGKYAKVSGAAPFASIQVTDVAAGGSLVSMHNPTWTAPGCSGSFDIKLEYSLPPSYKGESINFANASCSGVQKCAGSETHCQGISHDRAAAVFAQPARTTVTINTGLWSGVSTFSSVPTVPSQGSEVRPDQHQPVPRYQVIQSEGAKRTVVLASFD